MRRKISLLLFHLFLLSACHHQKQAEVAVQDDFFPLTPGSFREMEVSRTTYSFTSSPYSERHLIRSEVSGLTQNTTSQTLYNTDYLHWSDNNQWLPDSATAFWKNGNQIVGLERGSPVVQFVTPPDERNVWDGNAYNNKGARLFRIRDNGKSFQIAGHSFPETVTVVRQLDSTLLSLKKHILVYANDVGLVYEEQQYVNYCYQADCVGKGAIQAGYQQTSVIKNYGVR